jgi:hypothetical protein
MRPSFLVDIPAAKPREGEAGFGAWSMMSRHAEVFTKRLQLEDDVEDDDFDEDDDFEDQDDDQDDDEDEEDKEDEPETWQVCPARKFP